MAGQSTLHDQSSSADESLHLPVIWIIGGPGSGRTTQCKLLELYTRFSHVSSGDVLRNEVMSGSGRSLKIYNCMLNGDPVPDEIKFGKEMCVRKIRKDNPIKGFVMDGFPSDIAQAASFVQTIGPPMAVIHIDVNPLVMDFRLKTRNNFDDTPESIQKRISIFNDTTRTLLREWKAIKVDGNCPEEEVFESIKLALARENLFHEVELNVNLG